LWLVSEATGIYYVPIHAYFAAKGWAFTVVNPLSISKFREEQLKINKTDKEDCMLISKFGFQNAVRLGSTPAPSLEVRKLTQLQVLRSCLMKNIQRLGGVMENLQFAQINDNYVDAFVNKAITDTKTELLNTENKLIEVIKKLYPAEYKCMDSIKGVGTNMIIEIVVETDCLRKFKNMQQFKAYCGVVPGSHESGTSVYKKPTLAKIANRNLRRALYLCSLSATKHNKECRELDSRLPPHLLPKQRMMHVGKLLCKQIWYCVRNQELYKPEHLRKPKDKPQPQPPMHEQTQADGSPAKAYATTSESIAAFENQKAI
jgi:transposase